MINPILSFKEIIGIKTKFPSNVYSPNLNEIFSFIFISLSSIISKYSLEIRFPIIFIFKPELAITFSRSVIIIL